MGVFPSAFKHKVKLTGFVNGKPEDLTLNKLPGLAQAIDCSKNNDSKVPVNLKINGFIRISFSIESIIRAKMGSKLG